VAQPEMGEGVGCLIVSPEDMVELEAVEFLHQLADLLRYAAMRELRQFVSHPKILNFGM
jgi:hypothetical protein